MIRVLFFLVFAAAVAAGAVWLSDTPGRVTIVWLGYRVDTSAAVLAALVAVVAIVAALVYRFWRFLRRGPSSFLQARQARRRARGYQALTQGMVAVAAGDPEEAQRSARRADALLNDPPLTLLLSAQAAQLNGDEQAAKRFFTQMLDRPETAFLGVRGLMRQALATDDRAEALRLAQRAHALRPDTPWVQTQLLELQVAAGQWEQAEETLGRVQRMRLIDKPAAGQRRGAILVERARLAEAGGNPDEALALARQAYKAAPDSVPAAAAAIRRLAEAGRARKAARIAGEAWARMPHPDIAEAYLKAYPEADALERMRQLERLVASNPEHVESRLVLAQAAQEARLWGEARRHLAALVAPDAEISARACRLMAEIEKAENGDVAAAERWRARADEAAPDPVWTCAKCGTQTLRWQACCGQCGAFDSLVWRAPQRVLVLPPGADTAALGGPAQGAGEAKELTIPPAAPAVATAGPAGG